MQTHLNPMYREDEREMVQLCADQNIGLITCSPIARGWLAQPKGQQKARTERRRSACAPTEAGTHVIDAVEQSLKRLDIRMANLAS